MSRELRGKGHRTAAVKWRFHFGRLQKADSGRGFGFLRKSEEGYARAEREGKDLKNGK